MSSIEEITNAISFLQIKIPEQLFRIKQDLSELPVYNDIQSMKNHPFVKKLIVENKKLDKKNRKLEKKMLGLYSKINSLQSFIKSTTKMEDSDSEDEIIQIHPIEKENIVYEIISDEVEISKNISEKNIPYVSNIKLEKEVLCDNSENIVKSNISDEEVSIVEEVVEENEEDIVEEEVVEENEEDIVEEEVLEEEVLQEEVVEEEVVEEEVVEEEVVEENEEEVVEEEVVEEEVVEEEVVEEEVVEENEEEVVEEEVVEEEVVEEEVVEEEEEEEDAVYEITLKGKTYYVINEMDSIIYDVDENGDISIEAGIYKKGKPTFYTS